MDSKHISHLKSQPYKNEAWHCGRREDEKKRGGQVVLPLLIKKKKEECYNAERRRSITP